MAVASAAALAETASPVFRFFNTQTGTHFYTISTTDRDTVLARWPQFEYEGTVFYAYTTQVADTKPVYRFFDTLTSTHFYTQSDSERDSVIASRPSFLYEGPVYYAPLSDGTGREPLFRFFNTRTNAYFYADGTTNRDIVLANVAVVPAAGHRVLRLHHGHAAGRHRRAGRPQDGADAAARRQRHRAIWLSASVTDTNGYITRVDFTMDGAVVGSSSKAPFSLLYTIPDMATHAFKAVAYDSQGASSASDAVPYGAGGGTVQPPPVDSTTQVTLAASSSTTSRPATRSR